MAPMQECSLKDTHPAQVGLIRFIAKLVQPAALPPIIRRDA